MRLTVFNGSPRGENSNSKVLLEAFLKGYLKTWGKVTAVHYLREVRDHDVMVRHFIESSNVIIAFPLYVDSMPALVKAFIERLEPYKGSLEGVRLGFVVQSGFPESIHCRAVEKYLFKLSSRLGCQYLGTVVRGGVESIRYGPGWINNKMLSSFTRLGENFGRTGQLDRKLINRLSKRELFPNLYIPFLRILNSSGLLGSFWNKRLKENNVYSGRFARPYQE